MSPSGQQGQLELAELDAHRPVGRVEAAVRRAVRASHLTESDAGAAEAAATLGRGLDLAAGRGDPYAIAAIGKPLMEQLARLHLDPEARGEDRPAPGRDPWDQLLSELGQELKAGTDGHGHGRA